MKPIVISALYKFVTLPQYKALKSPLLKFMLEKNICGTILLAEEGINGTVCGSASAIAALYQWFSKKAGLAQISHKESYHEAAPFNRSKVKLKKEIVTLGVQGIDPERAAGTYVPPEEWNALIAAEDVTVIDTRNDYEVQIGSFKGAVNPKTTTFRAFPDFAKKALDPKVHKKVAMYCTGGIRCEKSTAYLKTLGFEEVYHLQGGILNYLEKVPEKESMWEGECFVFDERVAVNHALEKGRYDQCYACRFPITEEDKKSADYLQGVRCPHCAFQKSPVQEARYSEREKQNNLAKARGESHIGGAVQDIIHQRRAEKKRLKASAQAEGL